MSRTVGWALAAVACAVALPVGAASAAPEDDAAELAQTIEVAWLMPGPFQGWATWPQTYLPDGVPTCGDGAVQIDVYKYGTPEMRERVQALITVGVLRSPDDDSRIHTGRYRLIPLEPCEPVVPGTPTDPGGPGHPGDPQTPADPGRPTDRTTRSAPTAFPARPLTAVPTYAG